MTKPTVHLICNAHLDPVWQWRWEEGCAEALSTFGNAVEILGEHKKLIFNHNEAVLYQWVQRHDPGLFKQIQKLVRAGRWSISGGWYLQPDVNFPGTESLIRQILVGRQFFRKHFGVEPRVAYNFDSFGHSGGLPQILIQAGYKMYIHMRPQEPDLRLPSDLYRWRGVDGSELLAHRIAIGFYHSEYDNMEQRLAEGTELALRLNRDVPLFWGLGNHGGGATRDALAIIDSCVAKERRVRIIHSTTEKLYEAFKKYRNAAPVVEGDLQRVFTGCYTSLSRIKRRAQRSLGELCQAEAICAWLWYQKHSSYPVDELDEIWRDHLFNDFHDILPGSCVEPAEQDALDQYGKVSESLRRMRLEAMAQFNDGGRKRKLYIPLTIWNANPSCHQVPVEVECVVDHRPKWSGDWHLQLSTFDGMDIPCQEEQPESLLPFVWRKKLVFMADLPHVGCERMEIRCAEGKSVGARAPSFLKHTFEPEPGLISSLDAGGERECLAGRLMQPLVVDDDGDSWGADQWRYRNIVGQFASVPEDNTIIEEGPIRTIRQSMFTWSHSSIMLKTITYSSWPVIEFRLRVHWAEARRRLKLAFPTVFKSEGILCEVPGGAITRPADGDEHSLGRWCMLEGDLKGQKVGFAVVNSGQHGLDFKDGEIRLSILRGAAYCHDKGFIISGPLARKYMDQGVHDVRLLVTVGAADAVQQSLPGLADWLSAPPIALAHLPVGMNVRGHCEFVFLEPRSIRLLATKRSEDGKALILRMQESVGNRTKARLGFIGLRSPALLNFGPFEIKTIRLDRAHRIREVDLIKEH